jgi:large subunit ribosomal protein L6
MWGTARAVVAKSIAGLVKHFEKKIDMVGVGYRASVQGNKLVMQLGYSHDVEYEIPADLKISCEKPTTIVVQGADAQRVGQVVRELQSYRKPEPYKGKGLIIQGQYVYRKEGKKK